MSETLTDIATILADAFPKFNRNYFRGVVARVNGVFDGENKTFWFLVTKDAPAPGSIPSEIRLLGQYVPRNSYRATQILNNELGTPFEYESPNWYKKMESHRLVIFNKEDLTNRTISLFGDNQLYNYKDIDEFLRTLRSKANEIAENERKQREQAKRIEELKKQENTAHERSVLTKGLNKLQEEHRILTLQQEEMKNLTRYIRQQGKLRFNPILDPVQNRIKTRNLYDGKTIIIDGGPGTGKTTTMIQRLKYLTDEFAIEEDFAGETGLYKLTVSQRDNLLNAIKENRDWIFFSPSTLLKEYLSDAMNREGLTNTREKVWNWKDFCKKVIRDYYHLFDPTNDNAPFKASRSEETLFYQQSDVINEFRNYILEQYRLIKTRFPKIDENATRYRWTSIALSIKQRFDNSDNFTLQQFVSLFDNLERIYGDDCRDLLKKNRETITQISKEIYILLADDSERLSNVEKLLAPLNIEQNEETEDDVDSIEEDPTDKDLIKQRIRQWYKRYCYSKINREIKLTNLQVRLGEFLEPILTDNHKEKITQVGELALFEQYAKYARGVISNIFGGFAGKYKRFRRKMLSEKSSGWNLDLLKNLTQRREGKELHSQEQSLLIGFINNLVRLVLRNGGRNLRHDFINAYKELSRPIVGVDEATDFCKCDIYAMESLLSMDYNSMTLCGDMMQRLTEHGLTDWAELEHIVPNPTIVDMRTSYRQSTSLLNVAKQLYADTIGTEPNYKAHFKSTKVPKPLAFISDDEQDKIEWMEKRIKEVYIAYDKRLPSIAIFLNNRDDIPRFVRMLNDTDFIADTGIKVLDGSEGNVLSDSNDIRVYPIDVVKGMEFDVVFFHNIDCKQGNTDLLKRYIYVGVSRAAFFLGITLSEPDNDLCKYFTMGTDWSKII